jgi:Tfp pilus assembly protein PilN
MALFKKKNKDEELLQVPTVEVVEVETEEEFVPANALQKLFPSFYKTASKTRKPKLKVEAAKLPRVNMLPMSFLLDIQRTKIIRGFMAVGFLLILAIGGVWFMQGNAIQNASQNLEEAQSQVASDLSESSRLQPVGEYYRGLEDRINTGVRAASKQANYSEILNGIYGAAPNGLVLNEVSIEYIDPTGEVTASCGTENDPFAAATETVVPIGCLTFSGIAANTQALSQFIRALNNVPTIMYVFVAPGQPDPLGRINIGGTAAVSPTANVYQQADSLINTENLVGVRIEQTNPFPEETEPMTQPDGAQQPPVEGAPTP